MNEKILAKVVVSAAPYWVEKPFDYCVPSSMDGAVVAGTRVVVPFGRGNRRAEGFVLKTAPDKGDMPLKAIEKVLDEAPVVEGEQIKLALWMRERFFCTVYSALKTMLPAGIWYNDQGVRRVGDKTVKIIELSISAEEALSLAAGKRRTAPQQAELLSVLCSVGRISVKELCYFTGANMPSVKALERAELVTITQQEVFRRPKMIEGERQPLPNLSSAQSAAYDGIKMLADDDAAHAALIFGVTGSGKTAVYLHLIDDMLNADKSSILLVPEIALTPQMIETFSAHFGDAIAVLHSSLAVGERYDEWKRIKTGVARVVIGTRSAVFAPVCDLGIIIIDEEQEDSYKSENDPRYNARDIAKFRCSRNSALLLLGSATPTVESRYFAETGKYSYFTLPNRYNERELPPVVIVDMKRELRAGNGGSISSVLRGEIERNLIRSQQSILFLNRRGAAKLVTCVDCGFTFRCPNCSVNLTFHSSGRRLMCHYCGHSRRMENECPDCGGRLSFVGDGTQKIEQELFEIFPDVPVLRMDTDTVAPVGSHEALLRRFRQERIPIMVGTQMVTKGLNFKNVTLVGVLSADQSLYACDYRSAERTFSLITQVIGRSGRGEAEGRAVIQTFTPENQVIMQAARQDYDSFYASEIEMRRLQVSPPFSQIYTITAIGRDEQTVLKCCHELRDHLVRYLGGDKKTQILGPAPLIIVRVSDRFRYRITVTCADGKRVRAVFPAIIEQFNTDKRFRGVSVYADNDPRE